MNSTFKFKFKFAGCRLEKEILSTASCKLETTIVCRNLHPEAPSRARCSSSSSEGASRRRCVADFAVAPRTNRGHRARISHRRPLRGLRRRQLLSPVTLADMASVAFAGRGCESLCSLDFSSEHRGPRMVARKRGTGQRCRGERQLLSLGLHAE